VDEVAAFEAKNTLGALLDRVQQGEEIVITRHGKPVARLVPNTGRIESASSIAALARIRARENAGRRVRLGSPESRTGHGTALSLVLDSSATLADLDLLPIRTDIDTDRHAWGETARLASRHRLSLYDASYLELARRLTLPLATLDNALHSAALNDGVRLISV
jgi:prevent-host-death family protein